jgi:hypothetical protein
MTAHGYCDSVVTKTYTTGLRYSAPPRLDVPALNPQDQPLDLLVAKEHPEDTTFKSSLKAMTALAMALAPQMVQAQADPGVAVEQVQEVERASVAERLDSLASSAKELKKKVQDAVNPDGVFDEQEWKVGDYTMRFRPTDVDLKPKFKDSSPHLRLKGEFLETTLHKSEDLGGGWTSSQGASARLRGQLTTYSENELDIEAGLFREVRGPWKENYQVRLRADVGIRHRFVGENEGLRAGVSLRQELQGGSFTTFGYEHGLYAEGRQGVHYNFETGKTELSYSLMAGPAKDFEVSLFGKKGKLSVAVGPEISGNNHGRDFDLGLKTRARLRF